MNISVYMKRELYYPWNGGYSLYNKQFNIHMIFQTFSLTLGDKRFFFSCWQKPCNILVRHLLLQCIFSPNVSKYTVTLFAPSFVWCIFAGHPISTVSVASWPASIMDWVCHGLPSTQRLWNGTQNFGWVQENSNGMLYHICFLLKIDNLPQPKKIKFCVYGSMADNGKKRPWLTLTERGILSIYLDQIGQVSVKVYHKHRFLSWPNMKLLLKLLESVTIDNN